MEGKKLFISAFISNLLSLVVTVYAVFAFYDNAGGNQSRNAMNTITSHPPVESRSLLADDETKCCQCIEQTLRGEEIYAILEGVVPMNRLAQRRAASWIVLDDPLQLPAGAENLVQRYLMALFHISTTQIQPWFSCNRPTEEEPGAECDFGVLQSIEPTFYDFIPAIKWLSSEHECSWAGVACDAPFGNVTAIRLPGQEIKSTLPSELGLFPSMKALFVAVNEFYGTLPAELSQMTTLAALEVHYNFFTGTIPEAWFSKLQLTEVLNIGQNFLTGTLSTSIGQLSSVRSAFLFDNMITGTIPTQIAAMANLGFTRLSRNMFSEKLPSVIGTMKLTEAWFHGNEFTGSIPAELGTGNLRDFCFDLRLHLNRFTGSIPEALYDMNVNRLDLYSNHLTGSISPSIGKMQFTLEVFRVRDTQLTGTVPTEIGLLVRLQRLWLHRTLITGVIPSELCALRGPLGLGDLRADCLFSNEVSCPIVGCCTTCCNTEADVCVS